MYRQSTLSYITWDHNILVALLGTSQIGGFPIGAFEMGLLGCLNLGWRDLCSLPDVRSSALLMFLKIFPLTAMSSAIPITHLYPSKVWSILARHFQRGYDWICIYRKGSWMWWGNSPPCREQRSALSINNGETCSFGQFGYRISSWVGLTWCSLWMTALRSLGSRQSPNLPFCFRR